MILLKLTTVKNICLVTIVFFYGFKFQDSFCNGCQCLAMLSVNISDIAIITIKGIDYCCIIHGISKSEAINLLENSGAYIKCIPKKSILKIKFTVIISI